MVVEMASFMGRPNQERWLESNPLGSRQGGRALSFVPAATGVRGVEVSIKSIGTSVPIRNNGIEIDVAKPNGKGRHGDLIITKTGLIWCKGRATRENGHSISWPDFIKMMETGE